jgi:hypothetical protein
VFVALTALLEFAKLPVRKEPEPAYVLEVLWGAIETASPNWTIELEPTLTILTKPTIAGIWSCSFLFVRKADVTSYAAFAQWFLFRALHMNNGIKVGVCPPSFLKHKL